jgi:hypothetical protein
MTSLSSLKPQAFSSGTLNTSDDVAWIILVISLIKIAMVILSGPGRSAIISNVTLSNKH